MRVVTHIALLLSPVLFLCVNCAMYHEDYTVEIVSSPPGAEVWKDDFYLGVTPYLLCLTATKEDMLNGYIWIPPLLLKKEGYRPSRIMVDIDLKGDYNQRQVVNLKPDR